MSAARCRSAAARRWERRGHAGERGRSVEWEAQVVSVEGKEGGGGAGVRAAVRKRRGSIGRLGLGFGLGKKKEMGFPFVSFLSHVPLRLT